MEADTGPSSIVPATQYLTAEDQHGSTDELPFLGKAGSVTIVHYDLWHRAMANVGQRDRFMVKFLFTRMSEPRTASWRHAGGEWTPTGGHDDALCVHLWDWLRGAGTATCKSEEPALPAVALARQLTAIEEIDRYDAAYRLGAMGEAAVPMLIAALRREGASRVEANIERSHTNPVQFDTAYGLTAAGAASVPALTGLLRDEAWWLRASAADILGDIGLEATGSVGALTDALTDESDWVRRNAVEALGNIGPDAAAANEFLAECLSDTSVEVRHNTALALAKIGGGKDSALQKAGDDENLYVRELSAAALARSGAGPGNAPSPRSISFLSHRTRDAPVSVPVARGIIHPVTAVGDPDQRHVLGVDSVQIVRLVAPTFDCTLARPPHQPVMRMGDDDSRPVACEV